MTYSDYRKYLWGIMEIYVICRALGLRLGRLDECNFLMGYFQVYVLVPESGFWSFGKNISVFKLRAEKWQFLD